MIKKLLLSTDLSECSKAIVDYLPEFKELGAEEVTFLYVVNLTKISGVSGGLDIEGYIESESKIADRELPGLVNTAIEYGLRAKVVEPYPTGDPVTEILNFSEEYDLILMGSRGRGLIKEVLLGSVSEGVISKSVIPVYVFKFEIKKEDEKTGCVKRHPKLFERILVGYDFSEYAEKSLEYARFVAKQTGCKVYLIHVEEPECDVQKVKTVAEELAEEGINAEAVIRKGSAGKQILKFAEEIDATTIFVGSKGRGLIDSLLGSTSDFIVRRSKIPVFVYKGKQ